MVNFEEEYDKLGDIQDNYYKPVEGTQVIFFMDNGEKGTVVLENKKTGQDEEREKVDFAVQVNNKEYIWTVYPPRKIPYSKTSLYGQITTCGKAWGELSGKKITLIAIGQGMKRRYTIVEASDLQKKIDEGSKIEIQEVKVG